MYLNRVMAFFSYLFRQRRLALCPARVRAKLRLLFLCIIVASARDAIAGVAQTGDVFPADNPFTLDVDEGIPDGNTINVFEAANHQTFFEGRHTDGANLADPADDTNVNFDITVGRSSFGTLLISGESALRDEDLFIGDQFLVGSQMRKGTGVVRITGFGSLYNNDPNILPSEVANVPGFASQTPRSKTEGFDVYVGRFGTGTLEITAGARAEIQDGAFVGDAGGAIGYMLVDGIDSFFGSGGFDGVSGGSQRHLMIIGRLGTGVMTVSNGATVATEAAPIGGGSNLVGPVGAALGSAPYSEFPGQITPPGGAGTATVAGAGSKWIIGGSLQVGGFDIGLTGGGTTIGDPIGDNTQYSSQSGRGTLYVNDGGLVTIRNAIGVAPTDTTTSLVLAIGRFGTVQLNGGTIRIGNPNTSGGTGGNQSVPDSVVVINDGVITGSGRINTGGFRNRYFGEVRVYGGQSLIIDSAAQFASAGGGTPPEPLVNYGKIEVLGNLQTPAQLEFVRAPTNPDGTSPVRPFINLALPELPDAPAFGGGLIHSQFGNLRFGSGLQNHSIVAFTDGMNNVSGRVVNLAPDPDDIDPDGEADGGDTTKMVVNGPNTTAVFEDDLAFGPAADLIVEDGGRAVVLNQHSFTMGGNLSMELSYSRPSLITVAGDVGIGPAGGFNNDLNITLDSDVLQTLSHGDAFKIIGFSGDIGNVDLSDPFNPIPDLATAPQFTDISVSPNVNALYGLNMSVEFALDGVYVKFLDPTMVGSGAIAPDFNGDGVVNGADFLIWQANAGIASGASVLTGDADADGDVDGADFLKWQRNVGKPMPWVGSGSSGGGGLATVPEPTSLIMLVCGGMLSLAFGRRRTMR